MSRTQNTACLRSKALLCSAVLLVSACAQLKRGSDIRGLGFDAGSDAESGGAGGTSGGGSGGAGTGDTGGGGTGGGGTGGGGTGGAANGGTGGAAGMDGSAFRVLRSEPEDGAVLMDPDARIRVECSEAIDKSSVTDATFSVTQDGNRVSGELSVDGSTIQFKPAERLVLSKDYMVRVSARVYSETVKQLKEKVFEFSVRDGHWTYKPITSRENEDQIIENPRIAASPSGRVAVAWHVAVQQFRLGYSRASRRNLDGSWTDLGFAGNTPNGDDPAPGRSAGVVIFDDGMTVIGHQPDPTNEPGQAELTCVDANGSHAPLRVSPKARTTFVVEMIGVREQFVSVLERTHQDTNVDQYFVVETGCSASLGTISEWDLQAQPANARIASATLADGVGAWTSQEARDAGTRSSVGVSRRGASNALSSPSTSADSAALADDVLLWRQDESPGASTIWASLRDLDWGSGQRLSSASSNARAPAVATVSTTINQRSLQSALGLWLDGDESKVRLWGTYLDDIHKPNASWPAAVPVSDTFLHLPSPNQVGEQIAISTAVVALSSSGNGMALWSQPTDDAIGYDVYAVPFLAHEGWQITERRVISTGTHEASPFVSLAMDSKGRAYATWVEKDSLMVGLYD